MTDPKKETEPWINTDYKPRKENGIIHAGDFNDGFNGFTDQKINTEKKFSFT
jgi:hypothetical protein